MIYLAIAIFVYLAGFGVADNDTTNFLGNFINVTEYDNGTLKASQKLQNTVPQTFSESGVSDTLSFIDALNAAKDFVILIGNIIFAPIGLFTGLGLPPAIALMIGLPALFAGVLGLISFIRSGN